MEELYWISRLDCIRGIAIGFSVFSGIASIISTIVYLVNKDDNSNEYCKIHARTGRNVALVAFPIFFICFIVALLLPWKAEYLEIIGAKKHASEVDAAIRIEK